MLAKYRKTRSTEIAERLLEELGKLGDPDQDNISFTVIKVNDASVRTKQAKPQRHTTAVTRPKRLTSVVPAAMTLPQSVPEVEVGSVAAAAADRDDDEAQRKPRVVVVSPSRDEASEEADDLAPARLRPRRVIVIK